MITQFITEVRTAFNPFTKSAKTCRIFLAHLPPDSRSTMKINTKLLPRGSKETSKLDLKFKDGLEMKLDLSKLKTKDVIEEVNRHSRILSRKAELSGN